MDFNTEENKKMKSMAKNIEKKSLEDIISSNSYYGKQLDKDLSKKHNKRKSLVDVVTLLTEVVKTENISLGKKFKAIQSQEKDLLKQDNNEIIFGIFADSANENPFESINKEEHDIQDKNFVNDNND